MDNIDLEREKEFKLEEKKLEEVVKVIKQEILNYISQRKAISEYIVENRKNVLDEYRDDEDKVIEYFDHERFVREEAFRTIDRRLKELTVLESSPYFGRVDFVDEELQDKEGIYIGRFGVTPKNSFEPTVVDWRAPVASLFYTSSLGKANFRAPMGNIPVDILLKRQYIVKKGKLRGMFDSEMDVKDEILQLVLSQNTGDKLKDIIMTIQEEQDNLIRQPRDKSIVVDGVAGSGKTTVALHRVAFLLYNYRESLQDKVLILGPNSIFMEYISSVLPSLGEVGVKQITFRDFALDILGMDSVMDFKEYMERVLSGDKEFTEDILYKTSIEYKDKLDKRIEELNINHFKMKDIKFYDKVVLSVSEVKAMFNEYYKNMPLFRRSKKIKRIIFSKLKDERDELVRNIIKEYKEALAKLSKSELSMEQNNIEYNRRLKIREVIEELIRVKRELIWLEPADILDIYHEMNGSKELTTDDLAPILYLKVKLEGLKFKEQIKHVVIDEAQDYSALQFMVVKELTDCSAFTIVGDSNQRIIPNKGQTDMLKLNEYFGSMSIENFELYKSYRSTKEIMDYANSYLKEERIIPIVREGEKVVEENIASEDELRDRLEEVLSALSKKEYENIALICENEEDLKKAAALVSHTGHIKLITSEDIIYTSGVVGIPSYFAKGLEFDAVVLIGHKTNEKEDKLRYVMSTRALHELYVFNI